MNKKELSHYFIELGKKGGEKTKEKYGTKHYSDIGKKPKTV